MSPLEISRRSALKGTGAVAGVVAGSSVLSACSDSAEAGATQIPTTDVPVGSGIIQEQGDYVITQPEAGQFHAFLKGCPHSGCPVTEIDSTEIVCVCHDSAFTLDTGEVTRGPSPRGLDEVPVSVDGDTLHIDA